MVIYCRGLKVRRIHAAFDKHTYNHSLVHLNVAVGSLNVIVREERQPPGPQLCVSESDLVPCHTELQACLEAKFSLEGHETASEERLHLSCTEPACSGFRPEVKPLVF